MKLTDAAIRKVKTPGKYFDGGGMFFELTKAGGQYWRLKYRFGGKEKLLALGTYPTVKLKEAREKALDARKLLAGGQDPSAVRKAAKLQIAVEAVNTLRAVAGEWMEHQKKRWEPRTRETIAASLDRHVFPRLGNKPIANITALDVKREVQEIEKSGAADQAGRVLQRMKSIFRWAVVHERLQSNPLIDLVPSEILKPRDTIHRAALPQSELPQFLRALDSYGGDPHVKLAMVFLILTACRPGEVRGARWTEIDLEAGSWTIPASRMKMRSPHWVGLSKQALEALQAMQPLSGSRELVFPSPTYPSKPISENTFNSALARMGYKGVATAHGFRAVFSTMANEAGFDSDVIEKALAHEERNEVRAAYHRAEYREERRKLLQWWADQLDKMRKGGEKIPTKMENLKP